MADTRKIVSHSCVFKKKIPSVVSVVNAYMWAEERMTDIVRRDE